MFNTFPSIRFCLMVGIGGGVPSKGHKHDVRLGDVVISNPEDTYGGVVQYDFGKKIAAGRFLRTGMLNKPPPVLLSAISALRSRHLMQHNKLDEYLTEMVKRHPKLYPEGFTYQGSENDQLFDSQYEHVGNSNNCDNCDLSRVVDRTPRPDTGPAIHYGLIASANQVMKDAIARDELRDELGVLCFEMEAAGLMNDFRCLIVRGISDYADSHKNSRWQEYAAAVAAAYAKELLSVIPASEVTSAPPVMITTQQIGSSS
jgi:nucleoside phosphorylase